MPYTSDETFADDVETTVNDIQAEIEADLKDAMIASTCESDRAAVVIIQAVNEVHADVEADIEDAMGIAAVDDSICDYDSDPENGAESYTFDGRNYTRYPKIDRHILRAMLEDVDALFNKAISAMKQDSQLADELSNHKALADRRFSNNIRLLKEIKYKFALIGPERVYELSLRIDKVPQSDARREIQLAASIYYGTGTLIEEARNAFKALKYISGINTEAVQTAIAVYEDITDIASDINYMMIMGDVYRLSELGIDF